MSVICPIMSAPNQSQQCRIDCALFTGGKCSIKRIAEAFSQSSKQVPCSSPNEHSAIQKPDGK